MNNCTLIGRLTKDIDLRYTPTTQTAVGTFIIAVNRMKKEDGADFIRCKVWGKQAEVMEKWIKKGHLVGIVGRIETGTYDKDGVRHYTTDVVVTGFDFLQQKRSMDEAQTERPEVPEDMPDSFDQIEEDLPF